MYRGIGNNVWPSAPGEALFFSTDPSRATAFGQLHYVDVTAAEMAKFERSTANHKSIAANDWRTADPAIIARLKPLERPTAAAGDERADPLAQILDDDRRRKREDPRERRDDRFSSDRIDERRQARDETTKPRYDKYTGERIDEARSAKQERGRGRGLSRSR